MESDVLTVQTQLGIAKYEEAVRVHPGYAPAHYNIGITLADKGNVLDAMQSYERAIELCPTYAEAHNNIGVLLKGQGKLEEAISAYRRSLQCNPNFSLASSNLSLALCEYGCKIKEQGRLKEAIDLIEEALFYNQKSPEILYHLASALAENGDFKRACIMYELTAHLNPRFAEAHNNLGVLYKDFDNLPKAIQCYQASLRIRPTFPEALNNMGVAYTMMCQPEDAVSYFEAALKVLPTYSEAYINLGKFLQDAGDAEKAIEHYDRCLSINPHSDNAAHNRLLASNYTTVRTPAEITRWHETWGRTFSLRAEAAKREACLEIAWHGSRDPARKIRIGYLSPDFNTHSVAYFSEAALKHRSRDHSSVYCYCASRKEDDTTSRLKAMCDGWRVVVGKKAEDVGAVAYLLDYENVPWQIGVHVCLLAHVWIRTRSRMCTCDLLAYTAALSHQITFCAGLLLLSGMQHDSCRRYRTENPKFSTLFSLPGIQYDSCRRY